MFGTGVLWILFWTLISYCISNGKCFPGKEITSYCMGELKHICTKKILFHLPLIFPIKLRGNLKVLWLNRAYASQYIPLPENISLSLRATSEKNICPPYIETNIWTGCISLKTDIYCIYTNWIILAWLGCWHIHLKSELVAMWHFIKPDILCLVLKIPLWKCHNTSGTCMSS